LAELGARHAVDNYLKLFDRVLLLRYYRVPVSAMLRVTGHSKKLLEGHLALAEKHFPDEEVLETCFGKRGIALEKSG
jgi:predicted GNAT family N-acyltransferase